MHELAIAEGIVDQVRRRLPGTKVTAVHVAVGALSGVVVDSLRFCFDLATEDTDLAAASLEVTEPETRCRCETCGAEFAPDGPFLLCGCGSAHVSVLSGQQLAITHVRVAQPACET